MPSKNSKLISIYPITFYFFVVVVLSIAGLGVSIYLSISHYLVYTDISYASFCAISKAINCDTVSQSPYSIFLGIPVPIWGAIGYVFMIATLFISYDIRSKVLNMFPVLMGIGIIFSSISLFLGLISAIRIQSYCIMCIVVYGISFALFFMIWFIRKRFEKITWKQSLSNNMSYLKINRLKALKYYSPILIIILVVRLFMPVYWHYPMKEPGSLKLNSGTTEDGSPWIGAKNPELTIIEYSDYMCFQCRKMHFFLRRLISENSEKIRLIHKHYPMDKKVNRFLEETIHPGSSILSLVSIQAVQENKFWEVNDYLYGYDMSKGAIFLKKIAENTGLNSSTLAARIRAPETMQKLQQDISSGLKHQLIGTPSYVINGKVYTGQIPPDILKTIKTLKRP